MRLALEESHIDLYWIESEGRRFEEVDFILPLTRRLNWKWAKWIEGGRLRTHFAICDCCVLKINLLWTKTTAVFVFQKLSIVIFRPSLQLILKCTKSELNGWKCVAMNFNVMFQMNKLFFSNTCQFVDFRLKSTFNYKEKPSSHDYPHDVQIAARGGVGIRRHHVTEWSSFELSVYKVHWTIRWIRQKQST